jgi:2-polyprenyl-3-methyl-5-hydroxy-6-metoxy-1,4-benzoquinol methylase
MQNVNKTIKDVKSFWEHNPLFTGESKFSPGSKNFFEDHRHVYEQDCFAGKIDERIFPDEANKNKVLDLGCGPGFWVIELSLRGAKIIHAADLTQQAISLTQKRAHIYNVKVQVSIQNAENMAFEDDSFSHVNCQGVIHHTPNTELCVSEIARILESDGTALISVYFKNIFLRSWPVLRFLGKGISKFGAGLKGRGRENIYATSETDELIRLYDGIDNPIGKAYSKKDFVNMLSEYFEIEDVFFHFFPARSLPFHVPNWIHKILDRRFGFLIYAKCRKK